MGTAVELNIEIFDLTLALQSVGGDGEFLAEIAGLVQAAWPTLLAELREGMARGDLRTVEKRARLAKAAARNVSARRTYDCALELETMTGKGDLRASEEAIARLEHEAKLLQSALSTLGNLGDTA
jgi:HPt (histidine-containing phosphotransfer) domain-containing protein